MLEFLEGELQERTANGVVLNCGGVGVQLFVPASTLERLPPLGSRVRLWAVVLLVEEERGLYGVRLYGFASRAERQTFELLRSLPGIGARTALGILSAMSPGELRQLVLQRDVAALQRFPGIGRKTAERLVLELHERIAQLELDEHAPVAAGVRQEAIAALIALGYSRAQAERAVAAALQQSGETPAVEQLIKAALQQLR